jgi:hypothetical protein
VQPCTSPEPDRRADAGTVHDPTLLADSELQAIGQTALAVALAEVDTVVQAGGEGTNEGKNHEQPQACLLGVLTWWGMGDVRGVSFLWRSCPSHRRAPPLTPRRPGRPASGAGGSGPDSWFRLRAGC